MSLLLLLVLVAGPDLRIPPSDNWEAATDPVPQSGLTGGQFFVWKKNPDIRLRFGTVTAMREDYTPGWVIAFSGAMAQKSRAAGGDLKVTAGVSFELDGARVAKIRMSDGPTQTLLYWLPGNEGDLALTLMGANGAWDDAAREEVERSANAVKGLRRTGPSLEESVETASYGAVFAAVALFVIGGLIALAFRRRAPPQ